MALVIFSAITTDAADYVEWSREEQVQYRDRAIKACFVLTMPFLWHVVSRRLKFLHLTRWWALPITALVLLPEAVELGDFLSVIGMLTGLAALAALFMANPRTPDQKA
ncbi:MAG TPA: hypothetical protein VIL09_19920 [Microvirga sp.]|jgi:hypothetical protein